MHKFEIKDANIIQVAVQREILWPDESRHNHRLQGILLVCSGFSCYEVADLFKHSLRTIQYFGCAVLNKAVLRVSKTWINRAGQVQ